MSLNLKAITSRLGYQQITSLSSASSLTVPVVDTNGLATRPAIALITPETQTVRWCTGGSFVVILPTMLDLEVTKM